MFNAHTYQMSFTTTTTDTEQTNEVEQIWEKYQMLRQSSDEIQNSLRNLYREQDEIRNCLSETRSKLMEICDHAWVREPPMYQERSWWSCAKCGNIK